ncbi:MAG TPA: hypothetical protein VFQ43_08795 [Nitrososphaera sp.]|nr:hypothetical protein [Nitrososphaera sp.]
MAFNFTIGRIESGDESVKRKMRREEEGVVGRFECNTILNGCELITVGECRDTRGTSTDLILTSSESVGINFSLRYLGVLCASAVK